MPSVLVVDDDELIRDTVSMILEDQRVVCQQATNGEEALRLLHASTDQLLVLLDLMMPRMTGKDVLDAVEANPSLFGRHAFILMTAAGTTLPLALAQMLERLDVPVIGKPFDLDHLIDSVLHTVDRLASDDRPGPALEESSG